MLRWCKRFLVAVAAVAAVFAVMQLVPYGRAHSNPRVVSEPRWDSPRTRELAVRACFDCHSNETRWPWYSNVAPMSWTLEHDVEAGRSVINFSEWNRAWDLAPEAGAAVVRRDMPPFKYRLAHADADLSEAENIELARGLQVTFGGRGRI